MFKVKELPLGSFVEFGAVYTSPGGLTELLWQKVSNNNDFMLYSNLAGRYCFDCPEPNNRNEARQNHGSNFYPHSNILQYLNATDSYWFSPKSESDAILPAYFNRDGFLHHFTQMELDAMIPVKVKGTVPIGSRSEFGKTYEVTCKVHLPSDVEICGNKIFEFHEDLGERQFDLFAAGVRPRFGYTSVLTRTPHNKSVCALITMNGYGDARNLTADHRAVVYPTIRLDGELETSPDTHEYDVFGSGETIFVPNVTGREVQQDDLMKIFIGMP